MQPCVPYERRDLALTSISFQYEIRMSFKSTPILSLCFVSWHIFQLIDTLGLLVPDYFTNFINIFDFDAREHETSNICSMQGKFVEKVIMIV